VRKKLVPQSGIYSIAALLSIFSFDPPQMPHPKLKLGSSEVRTRGFRAKGGGSGPLSLYAKTSLGRPKEVEDGA